MKSIALLFALIAFSFQTIAQDLLAQAKSGDNWGYISASGEFIIQAQYRNCHPFANGLAPIYDKKAKTFYFIKPDGSRLKTDVDKFKLRNIMGFGTVGFSEGIVPVQVDKKWGYMNTSGEMVADAQYDKATLFIEGVSVAKSGASFYMIDGKGNATKIEVPGLEDVRRFSNGLAPFKANGLWGFIDKSGSVICEAQFKGIGYMDESGLAWAKNEAGLVGFITKTGANKGGFKYQSAKNFSDGVAKVKMNDKWSYFLSKGVEMTPERADSYGKFSEGLAYGKLNGKVGFLDKDGKWKIDPQFDAVRDFKNGYAAAKQGDLWGFIDKTGNWVVKPTYDGLKDFETIK